MEDIRDENGMEQARVSARRAAAKGERAAESVTEEAQSAGEDVKKMSGKAAARLRSAGENAYEEAAEATSEGASDLSGVAQGLWSSVSDAALGAWDTTRTQIERNPLRSAVIALAAGIIIGGILAPRD